MLMRSLPVISLVALATLLSRESLAATALDAAASEDATEDSDNKTRNVEARSHMVSNRQNAAMLSLTTQFISEGISARTDILMGYDRVVFRNHSLGVYAGAGGVLFAEMFIGAGTFELRHSYFFREDGAHGLYVGPFVRFSWRTPVAANLGVLTQVGPRVGYAWLEERLIVRAEMGVAIGASHVRPLLGATVGWRF